MSIFKYVQYQISCDECPTQESDYDNCTQDQAIANVRMDGWFVSSNKHLCPDCVETFGIKLRKRRRK